MMSFHRGRLQVKKGRMMRTFDEDIPDKAKDPGGEAVPHEDMGIMTKKRIQKEEKMKKSPTFGRPTIFGRPTSEARMATSVSRRPPKPKTDFRQDSDVRHDGRPTWNR